MIVEEMKAQNLGPRIRKVIFTHEVAATAAENATTTFQINGTLLAYKFTGGDAAWGFILNDGDNDILTVTGLDGNGGQVAISESDGTGLHLGKVLASTLKCTTTNVSTAVPVITIFYRL